LAKFWPEKYDFNLMEKLAQIGQISDLLQPSNNFCYYQIKDLWSGLIWNWTQITAPILENVFELGTYVHTCAHFAFFHANICSTYFSLLYL
jgi:hypothetical protein